MHAFIGQSFRFSIGCRKLGSPCRCRLWMVVKTMCVIKYYGSLALDLEAYIRKGNSFVFYFHFIAVFILRLSMLFSVN